MNNKKKLMVIGSIAGVIILALIIAIAFSKPNENTDETAEVDKSVYMDASKDIEERIDALMAQMTLEEKIGQMVQAEQDDIGLAEVKRYGVGSVLSGGGSAPASGNSADDWPESLRKGLEQRPSEGSGDHRGRVSRAVERGRKRGRREGGR